MVIWGVLRLDIVERLRGAGCVFAEEEAALLVGDRPTTDVLERRVQRRVAGEPLEIILGWAEFCEKRIVVEPGVFVPRARTELLARRAVAVAGALVRPIVVDLCCGSGAIGVVIATMVPGTQLYAADIDPNAVSCAQRNLRNLGQVFEGDLFTPLPETLRGRVDVLVANVPYVPLDALAFLPAEAREYEPMWALNGGQDGLDVFRRVSAEAPAWLAAGGRLLVEMSDRQAPTASTILESQGLSAMIEMDGTMEATIVIGTRIVPCPKRSLKEVHDA